MKTVPSDERRQVQRELLQSVSRSALKPQTAARLLRALQRAEQADEPIAIIGMAGRWAGAGDIDAFWQLCAYGMPQVRPFPESRRRNIAPWMEPTTDLAPGAYLEEIDYFDPATFGLSTREAELMDPVHRAFIEVAWRAFGDAGFEPATLAGHAVGVFAGYCSGSDDTRYEDLIRRHCPELASIALMGNLPPLLTGRISHLLNLRGPSLVIDTACSSSLVAVHHACQALRQGECKLALAGGVKLTLWPRNTADGAIGIESSDGLTRTFASGAGGTGIGEGVAALVLKPLGAALRDGDSVYAVIAGSACNHDGRTAGLAVPSVDAQREVIERAWDVAGVSASDIDCIEAHGTGTRLGDPIEFEALTRAFRNRGATAAQRCAVGSVKSLLGHLDSAAGITGLIRAALMIRRGVILPSLNFVAPNEGIDFLNSALYVNDRLRTWPHGGTRHAGVSAFSMNGTNCHLVLRQAPVEAQTALRPAGSCGGVASARTTTRARYWFAEARAERSHAPVSQAVSSLGLVSVDDAVQAVWRDVLGRDVAPDANFFAVGGDSLKATIVVTRLSRMLGRTISVAQLWRTATMVSLRQWLRAQDGTAIEFIPRAGPRNQYPVSPAQTPICLYATLHPDVLYNVPFAMRLDGPIDPARLESVVTAVCSADPGLAVRFVQNAGHFVQHRSSAPACTFQHLVADANEPPTAALSTAAQNFIRPFDLSSGPFARFALLQLEPERYILLMDFHHVVMDGVSVSVLWRRIVRTWRGESIVQPGLHALDYAVWRERRVSEGGYNDHRRFWARRAENLPAGRVRRIPTSRYVQALRHTITLDSHTSATVHRFASERGTGLFATLISVYAIAVRQTWNQAEFNIGTPLSGRVHADMEEMLGMFVNLYPVGMQLSDAQPVLAVMESSRHQLAEMFEYQDCPLDRHEADPRTEFNVVFALQNMCFDAAELCDGVLARPVPFFELPWQVAKFDLSLFAMDIGEQLVMSFEARRDVIDSVILERLATAVQDILTAIAAYPDLSVGDCLSVLNRAIGASPTFNF
ncbi:condensation domain-containing protein [Burkholderia cenocepacia]|uniref:condensation domain-containing protein n=1 Tax=Burkholderia cenocepacia TaxID=95486 RepID=UPI0016395A9C|nr:condensation domain-containing protein [Burkholderia cenocepacia]